MIHDIWQKIKGVFTSVDYNGDGYLERRARMEIDGHQVVVIQEQGSDKYTVFVDDDAALLPEERVEGWIVARVR